MPESQQLSQCINILRIKANTALLQRLQ